MRIICCTVLVAAGLLMGACGDEEREAAAPSAQRSELVVTVFPKGPGKAKTTRTVDCVSDPACDVPLAPTPPTTACTEIYGGPATATVVGVLDGKQVDAEFSLSNGCEINRWDKASALLGEPPQMPGGY